MKKTTMLLLVLLPLVFLTGTYSNAQENKESVIISMVDKLQQKVLLTEDQKNQVVNIIRSDNSDGLGDAQGRVEALLDQRQKAKYNIIKADWWSALNRELKAK
jgi:acyl-homoserine lactone acylase PvdQ